MFNKLTRNTQLYFYIGFLLIMSGISGSFYFYWDSGLINSNKTASVSEASAAISDLRKKEIIKSIQADVIKDNVRVAGQNFSDLMVIIRKINEVKNIAPLYTKLKNSEKEINETVKLLQVYPSAREMVGVLAKKSEDFSTFTSHNNWKTLGRMSSRFVKRLSNISKLTPNRLARILRDSTQDISIMRNVTESSVLTHEMKTLIIVRLSSLETEIKMLIKFRDLQGVFQNQMAQFENKFDQWMAAVAPEISKENLRVENYSKQFIFFQLGLVLLSFLLMVLGYFVFSLSNKKADKFIENEIVEFIEYTLLRSEKGGVNKGTDGFNQRIAKNRTYVQKRMSFGSIFQESLPFAAVMLDENLKVAWANASFCENWNFNLHEVENENISWDYIARYTNISDNDPVIEAFKNGLSGIYQVQMKFEQQKERKSFEMYVRPIEHDKKTKIMLYFYPLSHLEETIKNQSKSIIDPVKKTLLALKSEEFNDTFKIKIQKEFELAGISDVYNQFTEYSAYQNSKMLALLDQIDSLEGKNKDFYKALSDINKINSELTGLEQDHVKKIADFKDGLIRSVTHSHEQSKINLKTIQLSESAIKRFKTAIMMSKEILGRLTKVSDTINQLGDLKSGLKSQKDELSGLYEKLLQTVNQTFIFTKTNVVDPFQLEAALSKLKSDVKEIEKSYGPLSKSILDLDIKLSKFLMLIEKTDNKEEDTIAKLIDDLGSFDFTLEEISSVQNDMVYKYKVLEDEMVSKLKGLYSDCKKTLEVYGQISFLVRDTDSALGSQNNFDEISENEAHQMHGHKEINV